MEVEWIDRIVQLENDVQNWKSKCDAIADYLLEEFGFDIETKYKNGGKSSASSELPKVSHITFSTGNEEIDISKLRGLCMKKSETSVNDIQNKIFSLPSSTEVIEIVKTKRPHLISSSAYPDLIVEEVNEDENVFEHGAKITTPSSDDNNEDQESHHQTQDVEDIMIVDDDDDDSAFPLSIYDLEGDEDLKLDGNDDDNEKTISKKHEELGTNSINDENDSEMYERNSNNDQGDDVEGEEVEFSYTSIGSQNESQFYETEEIDMVQNNASIDSSKRKGRAGKSLIVKVSETGQPVKFQCTECNRTFSDRGNSHRHFRRLHPGKSVTQIMAAEKEANDDLPPVLEPETEVSVKLENPELGRLTHEQRKAASKLIRRSGSKFECKRCLRTFSVSCNAKRHVRVVHFGERLYSCGNCSKLFSSKTDGVIHEKICRNKLNKIREEEKKRGLQLEQLKFDELGELGDEKNDECAFQVIAVEGDLMDDEDELLKGPSQRSPVSLESISSRKRDGKLACKLCQTVGVTSQFENSSSFSHHAFYAHKKRVFEHKPSSGGSVCPKCSRNFGNETNMQAHYLACMKRAKPVAETTRTALLTSSSKLVPRKLKKTYSLKGKNDHMLSQGMIHKIEGDKPYFQCRVCRGTYENLQSAFTHAKRMHLTTKPHRCKNCPKSYFNKKDFLKHQMKCVPISNEEETEETNQPIASTSLDTPVSKVIYGLEEVLDISEVDEGEHDFLEGDEEETEALGSESTTTSTTTTTYPFNFLELSQANHLSNTQPFNFDLNNIISITEIVPQAVEYEQQNQDFRDAVMNNRNNNCSANFSQPGIRKQSLVLEHEGL